MCIASRCGLLASGVSLLVANLACACTSDACVRTMGGHRRRLRRDLVSTPFKGEYIGALFEESFKMEELHIYRIGTGNILNVRSLASCSTVFGGGVCLQRTCSSWGATQ